MINTNEKQEKNSNILFIACWLDPLTGFDKINKSVN